MNQISGDDNKATIRFKKLAVDSQYAGLCKLLQHIAAHAGQGELHCEISSCPTSAHSSGVMYT